MSGPKTSPSHHIKQLNRRLLWLTQRLEKSFSGSSTRYDIGEGLALCWALEHCIGQCESEAVAKAAQNCIRLFHDERLKKQFTEDEKAANETAEKEGMPQ
jgi:hypothetical protein